MPSAPGDPRRDAPVMMPSPDGLAWLKCRIRSSVEVKQAMLDSPALLEQIARVSRQVAAALAGGHQVLIFGNGGSAADAQHIAGELVGRFLRERRPLPVVALTTNPSALTAIGNDYGFAWTFARQIEAYGRPGDVALGISTSGMSPNVLRAIAVARDLGLYTVGLTGMRGGNLGALADECICVPSMVTPRVQEAHVLIGHLLCEWVEATLFPTEDTPIPIDRNPPSGKEGESNAAGVH